MLRVGVTIHREGDWYVAVDTVTGVTSQGKSCDEALKNFQEAFELWFENAEDWENPLSMVHVSHSLRVDGYRFGCEYV